MCGTYSTSSSSVGVATNCCYFLFVRVFFFCCNLIDEVLHLSLYQYNCGYFLDVWNLLDFVIVSRCLECVVFMSSVFTWCLYVEYFYAECVYVE
jgi:hypothetical protein